MIPAEKEDAVVGRNLNSRQDAAGAHLLPGRLSSGGDSSSAGEGVTSAPSAVDGAPSSAKKGGKGGNANAPVMKKDEEDVSFLFARLYPLSFFTYSLSFLLRSRLRAPFFP